MGWMERECGGNWWKLHFQKPRPQSSQQKVNGSANNPEGLPHLMVTQTKARPHEVPTRRVSGTPRAAALIVCSERYPREHIWKMIDCPPIQALIDPTNLVPKRERRKQHRSNSSLSTNCIREGKCEVRTWEEKHLHNQSNGVHISN